MSSLQAGDVLCLPGISAPSALLVFLLKWWIPQVRGEDPPRRLFIKCLLTEPGGRESWAVLSVTRAKKALAFRNTKLTAK